MQNSTATKPQWTDDEQAILDRVQRLRASLQSFGDVPPPAPKRYRHQFQNFDFWFIFAGMIATFLPFTSWVTGYSFEPLLSIALFCQFSAMLCNLTRDRVELEPKPRTLRAPLIVINFAPKQSKTPKTFREAQKAAGIKIVEN